MNGRKVAIYYAWSHPAETGAPLVVINNRFPALFETRRMQYPRFAELEDPDCFDQGIAGFLNHVLRRNFVAFAELASSQTGHRVLEIERVNGDDLHTPLSSELLESIDTLIIISFDSVRTAQQASVAEVESVRSFLGRADSMVFVCPHHDIGYADEVSDVDLTSLQVEDFHHHGDRTIPPQQRFGGFARSLLAELGVPVMNRFGLRPAARPDGSPMPIEIAAEFDHLGLLKGVTTFNVHPHLPHLERIGDGAGRLEVLARQPVDLTAPPHAFTRSGHTRFDALLQSRPGVFAGSLLVGDATLWSSTAGGFDSLSRLWANVVLRPPRP